MGKPRQPINLIMAKGKKHLSKQEVKDRLASEVNAGIDAIHPPSYLPDKLKTEFDKIADELIKIEIMTNLDCDALARYVVTEDQYQKVMKKILTMSVSNDKYAELLRLQEKLFRMCRSAACDLGLTISSRCKLVAPKKEEEKPESKFAKFSGV